MDILYAAIQGLVQGIAEFLPISSSGHLVIVGAIMQACGMDAPEETTAMTVALHFGTLMSIVVVYFQDLRLVIRNRRLLLLIILATIPVGIVGICLKDQIEQMFDSPPGAGAGLLVTAVFLFAARRLQTNRSSTDELTPLTSLVIGLFQAVAILPGVSRAGSTIAAGLYCGMRREEAARFSFLIAIPAIAGATLVKCRDLLDPEVSAGLLPIPILIGTLISFFVGIVALRWLIRIVSADRLHWFAFYCLAAGSLTIVWQLLVRH